MIVVGRTRRRKPLASVRWRQEGRQVVTVDGRQVGRLRTEQLARHIVRTHNARLEDR